MKKTISFLLCLLLVILLIPQAIAYESVDSDFTYISTNEPGEDIKMTIYSSRIPSDARYEIEELCFFNSEGFSTGVCLHYTDLTVGYNGETNFVEFLLPESFGVDIAADGYVRILVGSYTLYAYYDIENFFYPDPYAVLVPGEEVFLSGNNIVSDSIYIDGNKVEGDIDSDSIVFTVPEGISSGFKEVQLRNPYSNTIELYVAPDLYDDPHQDWQWYMVQSGIFEAHKEYEPSEEITVAVIGSGVDIGHEDLESSIWVNEDEVDGNGVDDDGNGYVDDIHGWTYRDDSSIIYPSSNHGTKVAGVIAAEQNNGKGIAGIAKNTKIMSLDVTDDEDVDGDYVIDAIYYAADNGVDIITLSLAGQVYQSYAEDYDEAIEYAYNMGCVIVIPAGDGNDNDTDDKGVDLNGMKTSPVANNSDMTLGVGGLYWNSGITYFSNYGSKYVDSSALGSWVETTIQGDGYSLNDGTYLSAAIVSGVAAMLKGQYPDLANWQIYDLIKNTGTDLDSFEENLDYAGRIGTLVNAKNAFDAAEDVQGQGGYNIFPDVTWSHPNMGAIEYLYGEGIISGYDDGTFKPENEINRAELLKILVEGQGVSPDVANYNNCFPDVEDDWYAPYVCYAKEAGWVSGYPDGTFQPANTVNMVESLKMLVNSQALDGELEEVSGDWYQPYVDLAEELGFLVEDDPAADMTRAGICESLYRILASYSSHQ